MSFGQKNKQWPHPPEALTSGVTYLVKFYGTHEVAVPTGMEAVKEATVKVKLEKQVRKAASGQRSSPKVEMVIGLAGIVIQDPKTKAVHYKFPLQRISYCADDKVEKKLMSFIAKDTEKGVHVCYVLGNERSAEEIILTIGQAFDIAYRKFLEKTDKETEAQKQLLTLKQQVQSLQEENESLRLRVQQLEEAAAAGQRLPQQTIPLPLSATTAALNVGWGGQVQPAHSQLQQEPTSRPQATVGRRLENLLYEFDEALYEVVDRKVPPPSDDIYTVPMGTRVTQQPQVYTAPIQQPAPAVPPRLPAGDLLDLGDVFGRGLKIDAKDLTIDSFDPLRTK